MSERFWSCKLDELQELWNCKQIDRYRDILPMVEQAARAETAGDNESAVWRGNLERIAHKIVDEWPFDDEHGLDMLRYIQAIRTGRR